MASLQERLDKAFGALGEGPEPAWQPSRQQIFRSGPIEEAEASSDEEYEERQRRETVPGLAQSLVDEDEPDEEGFRPSTAFCRALDAEEEYDMADEMATGLIARRSGAGNGQMPPSSTQVLEDNVYEQRARQQAALAATAATADPTVTGQQPTSMEVEEPSSMAGSAAAAGQQAGTDAAADSEGGPAEAPAVGKPRKQVRFEGVAQPWVPPARRPGYQPRCTELPPGEEPGAAAPRQPRQQQRQGRPQSLSVVPEHVKHPEKFTCYVLDEPLVVGGGVGQLSREGQQQGMPPAAAAGGEAQQQQEPEPERWQGAVGRGAVQFKPRQQRSAGAGVAAEAAAASGTPGGKAAAAAKQQALQLNFEDTPEGSAEGGLKPKGVAVPAAAGGDVPMGMAPMQDSGALKPAPPRTKRHYRSSRIAEDGE